MNYELFYLVGASKEADLDKIKQEAAEIVTSEGGIFEEKQTMDKRRMAYKIGKETHGIYIAQRFSLESPEKINSITKRLNLNADVMRSIISNASELPELLSKEERKAKYAPEAQRTKPVEIKKPEIKKVFAPKTEPKETKEIEKPEEKQPETTGEEIDKKLEEILNI